MGELVEEERDRQRGRRQCEMGRGRYRRRKVEGIRDAKKEE